MAITGEYVSGANQLFGVAADAKPANVSVNSLFLELDTADLYYFSGTTWAKVGGE